MKTFPAILVVLFLSLSVTSCEKLFNKAPKIRDQTFSIDENSPNGTFVGKVEAKDKSGQKLEFTISSGNENEAFNLDNKTGILTVKNFTFLNYETSSSFLLYVEVEDEFGKSSEAEITISLVNLPEITDGTLSVPENSLTGVTVGTLSTPDQNLTFAITGGNTNNAFAISSAGVITVNNESMLDYETATSFALTVTATNAQGKVGTAHITINIQNVTPPTSNLILYMPFDGNVNDLSLYGNNGIDYTTSPYVEGKWGQAKEFNGSTDYIRLTNTLNNATGVSVSFWAKTYGALNTENNAVIISKYSMSGSLQSFIINSCGVNESRIINRIYTKYGGQAQVFDFCKSQLDESDLPVNLNVWTMGSQKVLTLNAWSHCVVNMTSTHVEIWIDGVLCAKRLRAYPNYLNSPDIETLIGNCAWCGAGSNNHFHGALDELRVYNRSLTEAEIQLLFKEI